MRRLLILGGTWFLGRTLAEQATAEGWQVTCFNRGRSGVDVPGVASIRGDRTDPAALRRLAEHGPWDAVIDPSAYAPKDVAATVTALRPVVGRYVLISTVSTYRSWPHEPVTETSALWLSRPDASESDPQIAALGVAATYGTLKVGCEQAATTGYGDDATLIVRPGVILGPYEYVGRLPTLLERAARGGRILAPGPADRPIQPVDVRDLTAFVLRLVDHGQTGVFNVAAPTGHATYADLLDACLQATGSSGSPMWVDPIWLTEQDVRQWTEIPLWRTAPGTWEVDTTKARDAGLVCRPLRMTVADTHTWLRRERPVPHPRQAEHGMDPDKEARLLEAWDAACSRQA